MARRRAVRSVAAQVGASLPSGSNADQQATAAKLRNVASSAFDLTYDQAQVTGHNQSIAGTDAEITAGTSLSLRCHRLTIRASRAGPGDCCGVREFVVGDEDLATMFARVNPHLDEPSVGPWPARSPGHWAGAGSWRWPRQRG